MLSSLLRKPVAAGALAGALTAVAVFGGTGAFLAVAQDTPDTTTPETTAPDTTVPDTQAPTDEDRQAQMDEWRQCMADNGVELPEPQVDENGRRVRPERPLLDDAERDALDKAMEACGPPPFGRHLRGGRGPALTDEQRQCMADAGFELPEPQVDENGRRVRPERPALDEAQREAFRAAAEACGLAIGGPGCDRPGEAPSGNGESTPESTEPNVEGSSYNV
jgi:hypothetical protein